MPMFKQALRFIRGLGSCRSLAVRACRPVSSDALSREELQVAESVLARLNSEAKEDEPAASIRVAHLPLKAGEWSRTSRRCGAVAIKLGMSQVWTKEGTSVAVTLLQVRVCVWGVLHYPLCCVWGSLITPCAVCGGSLITPCAVYGGPSLPPVLCVGVPHYPLCCVWGSLITPCAVCGGSLITPLPQIVDNEVVMVRTREGEGYNGLQVGAVNHPKIRNVSHHSTHTHTHTPTHTHPHTHTHTHTLCQCI